MDLIQDQFFKSKTDLLFGKCDYILPEPGWMKHWLFCEDIICEHINQWPKCYENPYFNWEAVVKNIGDYPCILLDIHR